MELKIRGFTAEDAKALTDIFYDAVHGPALQYYSQEQVNAWAPLPRDYPAWQARLTAKPPFVALFKQTPVGFITLEADGHIDWTYTHKDYQRRGIAGALYTHLEKQARAQGIAQLYVEASYLARPFFAKQGFVQSSENQVERHGQILVNFSMYKSLE
ncbi:GNAT family N-acetyltransferase [Bowmanella denitrificans]|uniref:GNAT family N-acetyltransferase n=1 Tax=Bowmanella denitrificans TaxID=366582 RepID=UPI000C9D1D08|nr:GNAT family N-acetyltransferase [Bowmanella denitrificans]